MVTSTHNLVALPGEKPNKTFQDVVSIIFTLDFLQRRLPPRDGPAGIIMPQYTDSNGVAKMSNGYPEQNNSPNSSQLSGEHSDGAPTTLISRTQKQHTTQQVYNLFIVS